MFDSLLAVSYIVLLGMGSETSPVPTHVSNVALENYLQAVMGRLDVVGSQAVDLVVGHIVGHVA